ncbi:NupC/NupG family nucleoside CNT transporter [Bacillus wiedmannii]|nr:nucleoside transporter C-terminal domain-containing protein [Bacillus wiedmannii]PEM08559.1 NupC/NupG family nucleoside CNT transporter [Bacillus wiedmannii]
MGILTGILGVLAVLALCFLLSGNKKNINFKAIGIMLVLQVVATVGLLKTSVGETLIKYIDAGFGKIIDFANTGITFVTGGLVPEGQSVFFISVLLLMVFTSALLSVLTYIKILPICIKFVGGLLSKVTGLPKLETFNAANSVFFGQTDALLAVKNYIPTLNKNRMFIITTSAMASVSASIVGAYVTMLEAKYVFLAMVLNMFSGLIVASMISPVEKEDVEEEIDVTANRDDSFFDALSKGAIDGGKCALVVAVMLIAFIGMVDMLNFIFDGIFGITLQGIMGYVFAPVAFLMGIPTADLLNAGSLMGTKLVANEFVAMLDFVPMMDSLAPKTVGIISVFLTSFAAIGSIGMIAGGVQVINGVQAKVVARFGLKMLLAATLASTLSATITGLFL